MMGTQDVPASGSSSRILEDRSMSAKRNHYTSTPLMRMDKHPKSVEWEEAPVVLEQDVTRVRHYKLLQVIMIILLPIAFIVTLILGQSSLSWGYVGVSMFFVMLMWLLRAFAQSARAKLTLIYVLAAAVVVVRLIVSTPGSVAQRVVSRVDSSAIFNSGSALDTPTLSDFEATDAVETPEPVVTEAPRSAAEMRLDEFMEYWKTGDRDSMVNLCSPSWVDATESPKGDLFRLTGMVTPSGYYVERVDGSNTDSSRAIMMIAYITNQDGTTTAKRYQIMMVRSNDTWYINPNSLNAIGTVTEEDQPFEQVSSIITEATPSPTPAPTINPSMVLYYNTNGGKKYHVDPYCPDVGKQYQPLTGTFLYAELDDAQFRTLTRCRRCNAPERITPIN